MKNPFKHETPPVPGVQYPETAQDGGHPVDPPNAHPKYFNPSWAGRLDDYRNTHGAPPQTENGDAHWLTSTVEGHTIPYVGLEQHGVDITPGFAPSLVDDIDLIAAHGVAYGRPLADPHVTPVPVTVVNPPDYFGVEHRFTTNTATLATGTPVMLCGKRPDRTLVRLLVASGGPVNVGPTPEQLAVGFIIPVGAAIELNTNMPVWVSGSTGTVISCVEEVTIIEGAKRL